LPSRITLRPATAEDVAQFYGGASLYSVRAIAADLDGKIVGVGGVYRVGKQMMVFTEISPEMRPYKKDIIRASRLVLAIINKYSIVSAYIAPEIATAETFGKHFGFEEHGKSIEGRRVSVRIKHGTS
jgi:hypothetical protein